MSGTSSPDNPQARLGRVEKYHANYYYVKSNDALYECFLKGILKKAGTGVLVGDRVVLDSVDDANQSARIAEVCERRNELARPKVANVDQGLVVYSLREPELDCLQLDRYLAHIELAGVAPAVCISKADLAGSGKELDDIRKLYADTLGYPVVFTSVYRPETLAPVRELVHGKISVLAGPSGAGKSSLLNVLKPELNLKVGEVSEKLARGQHTTRHVELIPIDEVTYIADTPGFSQLSFDNVMPHDVEAACRDFAPFRADCDFSDCLHMDEAGCAVRENLGKIANSRYASYLDMIREALQYKEQAAQTSEKEEYGYKKVSKKGKGKVNILKLKEKDRDVSRRTRRQEVHALMEDLDALGTDDFDEADAEGPQES